MEENKKIQDGGNKMLSISILVLNNLHVLFYFATYKLRINVSLDVKNIFCLLD